MKCDEPSLRTPVEADDELIWRICPYVRGNGDDKCDRCPRWEQHKRFGQVQRGCRALAEEVVNICQTGNPWRKDGSSQ